MFKNHPTTQKGNFSRLNEKQRAGQNLSHADKCIINCSVTMGMKFAQNLQRYKAAV
jgi:hypothetical protein